MNHFICSENSNYTSIINTCVVEGEVVIYEASKSKELCRIDCMPESIKIAAADKINVYACTEAWYLFLTTQTNTMQALFHSPTHASGIKTAEEGLQRIKSLSFAQKRQLVCHLHSKGDTIQNLKFALFMQTCTIRNRKARSAKEQELILFSLQKLWQSFTF